MLIIAIPKSASTALMLTLGLLHGLPARQVMFPRQAWPKRPRFDNLARLHSDARELVVEQRGQFLGSDSFHKQHIVPTDHNVELLAGTAPVVLVREPEDIVTAYRRADGIREHPPRPAFKGLTTEEDWQERAEEIGLIDELTCFRDTWSGFDGALVLEYSRVVSELDACIDAIEDHWGLPRSARPVSLVKARYSRMIAPRRQLVRWYRFMRGRYGARL